MDRTTAKLLFNSLYGRLGMKKHPDIVEIVDSNKAEELLSKYEVLEQCSITDKLELIRYTPKAILGFEELYGKDEYINFLLASDSKTKSTEQSLPSAIAITAYSRMYMFKIIYRLIDLDIKVLYMDTDSIVTDKEIPVDLIGKDLGLFKLEHDIVKGYFIAPKLYALKTKSGEEIVKARSIGHNLEYKDFESLITGKSINKIQERWFKDPSNANLNIKIIEIKINPQVLKRKPIYFTAAYLFFIICFLFWLIMSFFFQDICYQNLINLIDLVSESKQLKLSSTYLMNKY